MCKASVERVSCVSCLRVGREIQERRAAELRAELEAESEG
jgi:hypothetical protein